jgi:hypothetical protein
VVVGRIHDAGHVLRGPLEEARTGDEGGQAEKVVGIDLSLVGPDLLDEAITDPGRPPVGVECHLVDRAEAKARTAPQGDSGDPLGLTVHVPPPFVRRRRR